MVHNLINLGSSVTAISGKGVLDFFPSLRPVINSLTDLSKSPQLQIFIIEYVRKPLMKSKSGLILYVFDSYC
jgi:hypothetical protein